MICNNRGGDTAMGIIDKITCGDQKGWFYPKPFPNLWFGGRFALIEVILTKLPAVIKTGGLTQSPNPAFSVEAFFLVCLAKQALHAFK